MFLQLEFEDNILKNAVGNFIEKGALGGADNLPV